MVSFILNCSVTTSMISWDRATARFCMTYMSFVLKAFLLKPPINQIEVLTAVVDLLVVNLSRFSLLDDGDVLPAPVPNTRQRLGQMNGRAGIVTDSEQKHLPVKFIDSGPRDCPGHVVDQWDEEQ